MCLVTTTEAKSHHTNFEQYQKLINPHNFKYLVNGNIDSEQSQLDRHRKMVTEEHTRGVLGSYFDQDALSRTFEDLSAKSGRDYQNEGYTLATHKPKLHTEKVKEARAKAELEKPVEVHFTGHFEKELMQEIQEKPINLIGEPTLINYCPHDCNHQGL